MANTVVTTVCRLEAGAPSRDDARLGDQRDKVARPVAAGGARMGQDVAG